MTEQEALIRAREATLANGSSFAPWSATEVREGKCDRNTAIQAAKRALLDLDKPLPVDRDLADLRDIVAAFLSNGEGAGRCDVVEKELAANRYADEERAMLPTFRAIIQRRIEEAGK